MKIGRRTFLQTATCVAANGSVCCAAGKYSPQQKEGSLAGEVGITTSSLSGHIASRSAKGKVTLLELPKIMREELDMRVIDLNTATLASTAPAYLEQVRTAADKAGCVLTNLKMNQSGLNMNSAVPEVRAKALRVYKRSIDAASLLGLKWARPLPLQERPDMKIHVASYRELAEYGAAKGVRMLVENYGWMQSDPLSVVKLIQAVDRNLAASPDTGNWNSNQLRYEGLAASFPYAVSCDFKARKLGPDGSHDLYDLERCFRIGWKTGFRGPGFRGPGFQGPWCLEHANADRKQLFRELGMLRDMLRRWMQEAA